MGLIKAASGAIGGTLHDQWKEAIRCEDLGNEILMKKKTTDTGVITNKSTIIVAPGQCAIIYDNGKIIDATAEEGIYTFDNSSSPSFFAGQFGAVFKEMWQRFTYNGATAKEQAVFFFNIKEIIKNKFGTPAPVPFQDWSHAIPNQMTGTVIPFALKVKCFGTYTFQIVNPALFMNKLAGTKDEYRVSEVVEQFRSEIISVFQNVLNELGNSKHKVPVLELPSQTDEIKEMMDEKVFDDKIRERGISIVGFNVESVTLDEESDEKIKEYEHNANTMMQAGRAFDVMGQAASNANGSMTGFMGLGMMNLSTGGAVNQTLGGTMQSALQQNGAVPMSNREIMEKYQAEQETQNAAPIAPVTDETTQSVEIANNEWKCECGTINSGKFCTECGKKKPEVSTKKFCPECGKEVDSGAKFCNECGTKL